MKRKIMIGAAALAAMAATGGVAQATTQTEYTTVTMIGGSSFFSTPVGSSCHPLGEGGRVSKVTTQSDTTWQLREGFGCSGVVVASGTGTNTVPLLFARSISTNNPS